MTIAERLIAAGMSEAEARAKATTFASLEEHVPTCGEALRWFVPGRIEVLGKHTDYAGGRSLLCTAERGICIAARPRTDWVVRIEDIVRHINAEIPLSPELPVPNHGWTVYPSAVIRRIARNFPGAVTGADIVLASDLASAAGMSTSSALVVAIFAVLSAVNGLPRRAEYAANIGSPLDLAGYLGCIENGRTFKALPGDFGVGTFGGSEDHTAILTSEPRHLKQYSFAPVRFERAIKLPDELVFVIGVSGVVADKTGSARELYNRAALGVRSVLDVWLQVSGSNASTLAAAATGTPHAAEQIRAALFKAVSEPAQRQWLSNRFEQFLLESETIIPLAGDALARGDLREFGKLVDQSQDAAEKLLGNQVPETIRLAKDARSLGAYAASAFGAGFGGSVWALVERVDAVDFLRRWRQAYQRSAHAAAHHSLFFVTPPGSPLIAL